MASKVAPGVAGLDGIVAAETRLSDVDGERGKLILAGHDVERLAATATFEDACGLFWGEALPDAAGRERIRAELADARRAAFEALPRLGDALSSSDATASLRAALGHVGLGPGVWGAASTEPGTAGASEPAPVLVTAASAVFAAAWARRSAGEPPVAPDASLGHAADTLRMMRGKPATEEEARGLDAYWVTVSDHGMNASTFAARVVASTGSDLVSAIVAAVGALKGPLHGGAPGPVLDMLDAIGAPERAEGWLESELVAGRRIMGMGHRIYRVRDPRAAVLEAALLRLERSAPHDVGVNGHGYRLELARAVERAAVGVLAARRPDRALKANVEFYTAVLLDALGIPRALFTPMFAAGRVIGWCAHVAEQRRTGRLIRPESRYIGPLPR